VGERKKERKSGVGGWGMGSLELKKREGVREENGFDRWRFGRDGNYE
jgi:hypothetical protein